MNATYLILLTSVVGLAFFSEKTGQLPTASTSPPATFEKGGFIWVESDFTDWKSRAELQYLQDNITAGQYFAHVEGRNNHGRLEYRAVLKPFPADTYQQWAVFWGIDETELFSWELRLLRAGFERKEMQVFTDSAGKSIHQIVWLQPLGLPKSVEISPAPQIPIIDSTDAGGKDTTPSEQAVMVSDPPSEESPPPKPPKPVASVPTSYTIQSGDTVEKIARRNHVSVTSLKSANHLKTDYLRSGKKLIIPAPD